MFETFDRRRREGRSRFRPLLEAAWEGVSAPSEHVDWSFSLSPAYPSSWPPSPEGRLVYYAKARGRDRRCPDAWHRAPVWARVETVRDGSATPRVVLEHSEVAPEKRPAIVIPRTTTHEILVRELESAMWETFELLLTTPALPDEDAPETRYLRECYGLSGGSPRIRERHAAFFRWLEA